jgi:hypothetical protein
MAVDSTEFYGLVNNRFTLPGASQDGSASELATIPPAVLPLRFCLRSLPKQPENANFTAAAI